MKKKNTSKSNEKNNLKTYHIYDSRLNMKIDNEANFKKLRPFNKHVYVADKKHLEEDHTIIGHTTRFCLLDAFRRKFFTQKHNDRKTIGKARCKNHIYYVYQNEPRHVYGYAWVGNNNYIAIKRTNPIAFIIPILIALCLLICTLFSSCPNPDILDFPIGDDISSGVDSESENAPLCYFIPLAEQVTLTKDNPTIPLINVDENKDNYYISYEILIDGKSITDSNNRAYSSGCIAPSKQVNYPLWKELNAGTYSLTLVATEYDYKTLNKAQSTDDTMQRAKLEEAAKRPAQTKLTTKLIIKK